MKQEIEKLIDIAARGEKITARQRELIRNKATSMGEDPDEAEFLLDIKYKEYHNQAELTEKKPAYTSLQRKIDEPEDDNNYAGNNLSGAIENAGQSTSLSNNPKGKSRMTAFFLALFLGGLGAHKFYIGNYSTGLLYCAFCWTFIPAILGLIDAIVFLSESDEKFYEQIINKN